MEQLVPKVQKYREYKLNRLKVLAYPSTYLVRGSVETLGANLVARRRPEKGFRLIRSDSQIRLCAMPLWGTYREVEQTGAAVGRPLQPRMDLPVPENRNRARATVAHTRPSLSKVAV